eukprot:TRINITY_DN2278_c0_g1_i1.p1 TRINITY_DN2278_c0_g1~~TRINITY_DN2278_c0_g1_i1.p1  ORF type:complete len:185 (-),score=54.56 TRINITY_DN2278_c0_g1_i1:83-637(-)
MWQARVIAVVQSDEEANFLQHDVPTKIERIIVTQRENFVQTVMETTGDYGVDYVLDVSPRAYCTATSTAPADLTAPLGISKRNIMQCLSAHGHWVTTDSSLQIDPPESRLLYLKGASLSFAFANLWLLSPGQHGRLHHIFADVMEKLSTNALVPRVAGTYPLDKIREAVKASEACAIGSVLCVL